MNIRVAEAANYIGLSVSTLNKLRCFGGGPAYLKLGRCVFYSITDLDAWVAERRRTTTWASNDNAAPIAKAA